MPISTRSYTYLLLWFAVIALISQLTPYFANDFRYMLVQGTNKFVGSFADIFVSQYQHYFEWGGRTVAHVIAHILLWWGKPASAVAQALCYVTCILFIYYNAYGIKPNLRPRFMPLFVISLLLFLQLRMYGEVVFNIVSSANYLWTTTFVLMFLLPYRISMSRDLKLNPIILWPMIMILGLIAGWSNENTAAAVATGLGIYLLWCLFNKRLKIWQALGYLGFLVGFALLIFAPGNQNRLESMEEKGFDAIAHTFDAALIFGETLLVSLLLIIAVAYLLFTIRRNLLQFLDLPTYYGSLFFIGTGFFSLVLMIAAPNFPARASTPFTIFTIIGIVGFSKVVLERYQTIIPEKCAKLLLSVGALVMVAALINALYCTITINNDNKVRQAEILKQMEAGEQHIVVSPMHAYTYKYVYVADVRGKETYWTNKIVGKFLQVESIKRKCYYEPRTLNNDLVFFTTLYSDDECK